MTRPTVNNSKGAVPSLVPATSTPGSSWRWHQYIGLTFPYLLASWRWLNGAFLVIYQHRAYRYIATVWTQVVTWLNTREGWHFMRPTEQYQLLKWVQSRMAHRSIVVTNFNEDWKDGVALCALIDDLVPGTCPRHDLLHPKQERLNIELGLRLAEMHLGVISDITPGEILGMKEETERKFQRLIARLRSASPVRHNTLLSSPSSPHDHDDDDYATLSERRTKSVSCFAKGMGLLMGVQGHKARFNIYLHTNECMDIVIELESHTNHDYCTERITVRSPRKKEANSVVQNHPAAAASFSSSSSSTDPADTHIGELTTGRTINIPLEYEVMNGKIAVNYTPPSSGHYKLSIISRGRHIFGSPFNIGVDEAPTVAMEVQPQPPPPLATSGLTANNKFLSVGPNRRESDIGNLDSPDVPLKSYTPINTSCRPYGTITSRKLLRSIVFCNGYNVVLEGDDPLPQDPRAWSASAVSASSLDVSDEELEMGDGPASTQLQSHTESAATCGPYDHLYYVTSGDSSSNCQTEGSQSVQYNHDDGGGGSSSMYAYSTSRSDTPSMFGGSEMTTTISDEWAGLRRQSVSDGETLDDLIQEYSKIAEQFQGMKDETFGDRREITSDYDSLLERGSSAEQTDIPDDDDNDYDDRGSNYSSVVKICNAIKQKRHHDHVATTQNGHAQNGHNENGHVQNGHNENSSYDYNGRTSTTNGSHNEVDSQSVSPSKIVDHIAPNKTALACRKNLRSDLDRVETSVTTTTGKELDHHRFGMERSPLKNSAQRISRNILPKSCTRAEFLAIATGLTNQRVPDALINDWVTLWNVEGEGIVKTRVKEWEKTLLIAEEANGCGGVHSRIVRAECLPLAKVVTGQVQSIRRTLNEELRKSRSAESINNCASFESMARPVKDRKSWNLKRTNSTIMNGNQ